MIDTIMDTVVISFCILGLFSCLYALISKKYNTRDTRITLMFCFLGFGWLSFILEAVDDLSPGGFVGIFCFFIGFILWIRGELLLPKKEKKDD